MFKAPFSFTGRIRRLEYGLSILIYLPFAIILNVIAETGDPVATLGLLLLYIPLLWFMWAQGSKRCHDLDRSGWFQLIPFYGLVMMFSDGDAYSNRFGNDPKGRAEEEADFFDEQPVVE